SAPARSGAPSSRRRSGPAEILGHLVVEQPVLHPANDQEIAEGLEHAIADAVLRFAEAPRPMIHRHLEHAEPAHLEEGGNEPVKALVEDEILETLATEGPEGTAAVLDGLVADRVAHPIGHARGDPAHPRIARRPVHPPAGDGIPSRSEAHTSE